MKMLTEMQYDLAWWKARRGKPTSSNVDKIVTPAKCQYSASTTKYIYDLIGDLYDPMYPRTDGPQTSAMRNGTEREDEARTSFAFAQSFTVNEVGLCVDEKEILWGSPDGVIQETGEPLEIKCPTPGVHVSYLDKGEVPRDYIGQLHGHMMVCGTTSAWFVSYCPGFQSLVIHYEATKYLAALQELLPKFHADYKKVYDKIYEIHGEPPELYIPEGGDEDVPEDENVVLI